MNLQDLQSAHNQGQRIDYLLFYGHKPRTDGSVGPECLSQWYQAAFEVEGIRYATAEHYMMAGKARVFDDPEKLRHILASTHPSEAKKLGRQVHNFDKATWKAHRLEIVVEASVAKFSQNAALGAFLLSTGDKVLVEAAPRDRIWGIGMGRKNPDATNPNKWRGQNLLGFALMEARGRLR